MGKKAAKKKEARQERSLVKAAARDLGVDYQKGMGVGDLIRSEADRLVRQSAASVGFDPDANDANRWRGVMQGRRDLNPIEQDRLIEVANYLRRQNPLANRICDLKRDFVAGDNIYYEAEDTEVIQPLLDKFWNDPVNKMKSFREQMIDAFNVTGELFIPVYINEFSGAVQLGWIDPVEVESVIADRMNRRIMRHVKIKRGATVAYAASYDWSAEQQIYTIANVDNNLANSKTHGLRVGDIFHFRTNCAPDATRGRSSLESWADLVDAWDQANFNDLERVQQLLNYIWDWKCTGKSEAELEKFASKQGTPAPGSQRLHNENVEITAVAPDLKMTDTRKLSEGVRTDVLGTAGFAPFFIGITETSNKASSDNLDLPILRGLQSFQRRCREDVFDEIGEFVIDQAMIADPALRLAIRNGSISRAFKTVMPELSVKDMQKLGAVMAQTEVALEGAVTQGWIRKATAARMFYSIANQFGVEYDPVEELTLAGEELAKTAVDVATSDYGKKNDGETGRPGDRAKSKLVAVK